jgi:predicted ATPase/DNA-binding SARP family transcriptional activator
MLEVKLLGQFEVLRRGKRLTIPTRNAQSLFAYLVLNAGKGYRRERLAGMLWPDSSEGNARSNLRHELWRLRKVLEPGGESYFLIDDLTIAFQPQGEFTLDVQQLENTPLEGSTTEDLMAALSVYHGELLPGFYEEWIFAERTRLAELFEARMARLLEILQNEEHWAEVQEWGARWIGLGGWPEPAYRALMTAYASSGDVSKAMATYERFSQGLQADLGVKPSEQTQVLYNRLKSGWQLNRRMKAKDKETKASISRPDTPAPGFALAKMRHSNIPRPMTSFIGREKEIQQVEQLISKARLVTITGAGGVGKTRLAIQVAGAQVLQFKDGAWWVELASLYKSTPSRASNSVAPAKRGAQELLIGQEEQIGADLVTQAMAKALRVQESPDQSLIDGIIEYLNDKKLLLVLDNCEHFVKDCATIVFRLLDDCPEVTILATSREALRVPGEKAWLLPSLSLPESRPSLDLKTIMQSEAVDLFIERAADVLPGYQPTMRDVPIIAQICLRLDGIPLAIELAAARMNLLSAEEIAARLDRRFSLLTGGLRTALPRHQTLRAAIEWSYDLLSEAERVLFRRLSIFTGGFTLEAAEDICIGGEVSRDETLTIIGRLVDKSLLKVEPAKDIGFSTRYRFLDTIRSFGLLKLDESEETRQMQERHADYYVRLVETTEPELLLHNQVHRVRLLQLEYANVRSIIEWSIESDQAESALRLVGALLWFWWLHLSIREGLDLALKALAVPSSAGFNRSRAKVLNTAGFLSCLLGDTALSRRLLEEALSILRTTDDQASLALSYQFLGLTLTYDEEYDLADKALDQGLILTRKLTQVDSNNSMFFLGDVALLRGDTARAKQIYEESANMLRTIDNKSFLAYPLRRLGYLALEQNDIIPAMKYFQESLALNHEVGDIPGVLASLASVAALSLYLMKPEVAARFYGVVENRLDSLSINLLYTDRSELGRINSKLPAYLDEAAFLAAYTQGLEMSEEQAVELAEEILRGED